MVLINSVLDVHEIIIFKKISLTQKLWADYQLEKDVLLMYLTKQGKEGATPSDIKQTLVVLLFVIILFSISEKNKDLRGIYVP